MAVRHPEIGEIRSLIEGELDPIRSSIVREHIKRCNKCAALWSTAFGLMLDRFEPTEELSRADEECPDPEALAAYQSGDLVEHKREGMRSHLTKCPVCRYALRCLESLPEESETTTWPQAADELVAAGLLEEGGPARVTQWVSVKFQEASASLACGLRKKVDAAANAVIQFCLAVRWWRARRLVGSVRNGWKELGRELRSAASEDISPQRFDRKLLRLEARISRGLEPLRHLESRTDGHNGFEEEVDDIAEFMRRFVDRRMSGTLAGGEARIMAEDWNGYYWFLSELMTTARPMSQERKHSGKGGGKGVMSNLRGDSEIWRVAAGVAAIFLLAVALKHSDSLYASLVQAIGYSSDCLRAGISNGSFDLRSLLSNLWDLVIGLKMHTQLVISSNRDLVTLISVVVLPVVMYSLFKLMPSGPHREAAYAPRR